MPSPPFNMNTFNTTSADRVSGVDPFRAHMEALEVAGKMIEKQMTLDNSFPLLTDRMRITAKSGPTVSGLSELDYPTVNAMSGLSSITQLRTMNKVPLPPEIMEHFGHMQCQCMMGVFPEINRAWLTIDSDIYIWDFEHGTDVAYYDGLSETIVSVGLVRPKPGVFQNYIRHLLVLTTTVDIVVLGVSLSSAQGAAGPLTEIHLTPEIIYTLPTDGVPIGVITGTAMGRIFLGGKDGSLFEIHYQKEIGWTGKRCKKVNHSTGTLSFLVPSFLNAAFSEDDSIAQISVDNSRHILYTLSDKGTISVFDLGDNGMSTGRLACLSQSAITQAALSIARTLDSSNFNQLVSISAMTAEESAHLGLVAVTTAGSRLYFSTGAAGQRPTTLQLFHVRLPPGFAANAPTNRPSTVHIALYSHGNLILVTSPGGNQDKVWSLSGDLFPLQPTLSETQSVGRLDGVAWALQEMYLGDPPSSSSTSHPLPPLIVRQHYEPARQFVILTPNGAEIMKSLRPVDVLSQLLQQYNGPESDVVKAYFQSQTEDQACATCLLLACDLSVHNTQLAEWATRAFFLYGGEPKVASAQVLSPPSFQYSLPPGFNPASVSTPVGRSVYSPPDNCQVQFSAKHNGLYLFISRILRPLWNSRIVQKVSISGKQYLVSSVSGKEVTVVASKLLALRSFLEKNTQFTYNPGSQSYMTTVETTPVAAGRSRLQEVQLQEKHSLDALTTLVDHSCQVLGLWKIMCEHQFHVITDTMPSEQQTEMGMATFRDLILVGQDICTTLINKLINTYLSDNTSIDPISLKLRNTCPKLYRNEDAACSKANEMINVAKTKQNREEQEKLLTSALKLCKEVAPQINLSGICRQLVACHYYNGVVELVLECAAKCDPKDIALHYYTTTQPGDDTLGYQAYAQRLDCYKEVKAVLDHLRHKSNTASYSIPTRPGLPPPQPPPSASPLDDTTKVEDVIKQCMESTDQLLHMEVYEWLVSHRLYGDLITVAKPSLELFLKRATASPARRDAAEFADLLWKYHERHGNHSAAAQILYSLAKTPGENLTLEQRITYLAKAVLCMRSDQVGCAPHLGVFLHELEDYLEVANVQKKVLDALSSSLSMHRQADDAIRRLNSCLLTITELYADFAEPYNLWECKLAIIDVSGHDDLDLIQRIWDNIIQDELRKSTSLAPEDKVGVVLAKVKELGTQYLVSSRCFPVAYLMWQLEQLSCLENASRSNVFNTFYSIGITFPQTVDIYKKMYIMNDRCWASHGNEFYLIEVIASLAETLINNPKLVKSSEKQVVAVSLQELITSCLTTVYSRPNTSELDTRLNNAFTQLSKL
ncbi:nuclear pore complex protein Nup155 [Homalodisca vitripennis]|nr:nuclear pore complex protein Nup155 [Homalodisca vitripennis]